MNRTFCPNLSSKLQCLSEMVTDGSTKLLSMCICPTRYSQIFDGVCEGINIIASNPTHEYYCVMLQCVKWIEAYFSIRKKPIHCGISGGMLLAEIDSMSVSVIRLQKSKNCRKILVWLRISYNNKDWLLRTVTFGTPLVYPAQLQLLRHLSVPLWEWLWSSRQTHQSFSSALRNPSLHCAYFELHPQHPLGLKLEQQHQARQPSGG